MTWNKIKKAKVRDVENKKGARKVVSLEQAEKKVEKTLEYYRDNGESVTLQETENVLAVNAQNELVPGVQLKYGKFD